MSKKGGGFRSARLNIGAPAAPPPIDYAALQAAARPGVRINKQTDFERQAGVMPVNYEGTRDVNSGELLGQYRLDPYQGEAVQALKQQAFAQGDSPWAQLQNQKLALEQSGLMDQAAKQGTQAMSQAQSQLAMSGGLSGGARERMARQGARDLMVARQGISRQGATGRMGIQEGDIDRKQSLLGNFANAEQASQQGNIQTAMGDIQNQALFDSNRYNQQMQAWGAKQAADAQRTAASMQRGGGKK